MVENNIKKEYICNTCNKSYKDKSGLWYHNNKYHSNNVTIQSPNCHHLDTIKSPIYC
jgi:hypothetical protein